MNNIDIAKGLIFKNLGIKKDSFNNRLLCQKKIFILQSAGINLGFSYNWYIRGPYSPDLTAYAYNNLDMLSDMDFSEYQVSEKAQKALGKVKDLASAKPKELDDVSWYELVASVIYINKNWNKTIKNDIYKALIEYKPQYTNEQFDVAFEKLKEYDLVS